MKQLLDQRPSGGRPSFSCYSGSTNPEAVRCKELGRNTEMLEESAKGDFGSGEVGPRLKDIEWRWATDGTQREVLP